MLGRDTSTTQVFECLGAPRLHLEPIVDILVKLERSERKVVARVQVHWVVVHSVIGLVLTLFL